MTDPQIRLELMSNPLYLSGAREMVAAVARRLGFADDACGQIALAVDEAICNIIRHGYDRAADKPIWISLFPIGGPNPQPAGPANGAPDACDINHSADALRIVIEDEARQVDPNQIKSRNLEDVRPGGLGVHIIRSVMDDVRYEHRQPRGMRLTMTKKRTAPGSAAGQKGERADPGCQCAGPGGGAGGDGGGPAPRAAKEGGLG